MTDAEQREAARQFVMKWQNKGNEDEHGRSYWIDLLGNVLGMDNVTDKVDFEKKVYVDGHRKRIDAYINETSVLIEQKSLGIPLDKKIHNSGDIDLTPYEQAKRYNDNLAHEENARWIVTSNFAEIWIYDMNQVNSKDFEPIKLSLTDVQTKYSLLDFLVKKDVKEVSREMEISLQAGELVGKLYEAFQKQYKNPDSDETLKSLNVLCVRIVFCLYAEDAGIFGRKNMFHDYMSQFDAKHARQGLIKLFRVLNQKPGERDSYLADDDPLLAEFPYVNGGLFEGEDIEIPPFNDEILSMLVKNASSDFDWSEISPTIFGAVFESTLNPETRRSGGMHYTSIENIHKVIDPLFLDELKSELDEIRDIEVWKTKKNRLEKFQEKLSSLKWLDPACGSGNFLTETYLSIRRLENIVIAELQRGQISMLFDTEGIKNPIKVHINQFYGIEINDFAVTVAKTALWIAESQMMKETEDIIHSDIDFLPLTTNANIVEANALRIDWNDVVPASELDYIMGNPPFVGGMYMDESQKKEIRDLFTGVKGSGEFDYVTGWYIKTVEYYKPNTSIKCAFVSTNSICQGSQVITFWKYILTEYNVAIDFAYTTFVWNSEAKNQAKVHCVIVGFSERNDLKRMSKLFFDERKYKVCEHISPYLTDTPVVFVDSRSTPLCDVPKMRFGSMPRDGGGFVLSAEEKDYLIKTEPISERWIKPYVGATEFINNKERYCLWLVDANPSEINKSPTVKERVEYVRKIRAESKAEGTRKFASTPMLFCQIAQPDSDYIIVPKTSSGKRRYIPLGFMDKDVIASDLVFLIPNAGLYEFGVLMSNVHNAWMRLVAGRLKSDYRYSKDIVYNNFPWITPTEEQRKKIEETAQGILDARALYPDCSLADMYGEDMYLFKELTKAHQANDRVVMQAYGFDVKTTSESDCVAKLMEMYQRLTEKR